MYLLIAAVLLPGLPLIAQHKNIEGVWITPDRDAHIHIYRQGQYYFGKMIWLTPEKDDAGNPITDTENPDPKKRNVPLKGMVIINDLVLKSEKWSGHIYDPESGETYQVQIKLKDENEIELRGYVGSPIFGRTEVWTRLK
ncbi:hypothetical protein BH09BAC3_BH09BAC3_13780 [soil metagenome]